MTLALDRSEGLDALRALAPEWTPLEARHPFADHVWLDAWWQAFGGGAGLEVHTARRDGELVAAFPVGRRGGRAFAPANYHSPIFEVPANDTEARTAVIAAAARRAGELFAHALPDPGPDLAALSELGRLTHVEPAHTSPRVEIGGDAEAYLAALGSTVKRRRRKLEREHEVAFRLDDGGEHFDAELSEGFAVEASGWKSEGGTAIVSRPATERFYTEIAHAYRERGELVLGRMEVDGELAAWHMCLRRGGRLHMIKTGYLVELRKLAPGLVLHLLTVERCFADGEEAYDMLGDADAYKLEFSNAERRHVRAWSHRRTPVALGRRAVRRHAVPLARKFRERGNRDRPANP